MLLPNKATFNQVFEDGLGINDAVEVVELDVKVVIEKAIIYLRFPIPDLRTNVQVYISNTVIL